MMLWVILKSLLVTIAALLGFGCLLAGVVARNFFRYWREQERAQAQANPVDAEPYAVQP